MTDDITPGSEPEDRLFEERDFGGGMLEEVAFARCRFVGCSFAETTLRRCVLSECRFESCEWTLPVFEMTQARGVVFAECRLVGLSWDGNAFDTSLPSSVRIERSRLVSCLLAGLRKTSFAVTGSSVSETVFRDCELRKADFRDTHFEETSFDDCNLVSADFRDADGFRIDPRTNRLDGARFSAAAVADLLAPLGVVVD